MFFSPRPFGPLLNGLFHTLEPWRDIKLQRGPKNRIRGWGRRCCAQTNDWKSWSLNQMKTMAASVTPDALAAPIGCIQTPARRPSHELLNIDSYLQMHQAGKRHLRICEAFYGGDAILRSQFLLAVRLPLEI